MSDDRMAQEPATGTSAANLDDLCSNTIRMLSIDAVQAANSGHPGMPMGAATMAYVLWTRHLRHNPANPAWPDRDRFVLSAGHASALLYSLLFPHRLRRHDERPSPSSSGSGRAARPGASRTRPDAGCRGHNRTVGPGRSPTASAWRWPNGGSPRRSIATATTSSITRTYVQGSRAMATSWKASPPQGGVARRQPSARLASSRCSTTANRITLSATDRQRDFLRGCRRAVRGACTGGTCSGSIPSRTQLPWTWRLTVARADG